MQNKCEWIIGKYSIYPVKGKRAREYLFLLGCSVGSHMMSLPDHLEGVQTSNKLVCDVMRSDEKVFTMQYDLTACWRIIVPAEYRMSFSELMKAYDLSEGMTEGIIGSYGLVFQLTQGIPVLRSVAMLALRRISNYVGHPYDLENVRIVLSDSEYMASGCTVQGNKEAGGL
jgi:hypothetical protein